MDVLTAVRVSPLSLFILFTIVVTSMKNVTCGTVVIQETTGTPPTATTVSVTAEIDGTSIFQISGVAQSPNDGTWSPLSPAVNADGSSFTYAATAGLTPGTEYEVTLTVAAASDPANTPNHVTPDNVGAVTKKICTLPEAATSPTVTTATDTSITISWTDPVHSGSTLTVKADNFEAPVNMGTQSYIFNDLQPGSEVQCAVVSTSGAPCNGEVPLVVPNCYTKDILQFVDGPVTSNSVSFDAEVGGTKTFSMSSVTYATNVNANVMPADLSTAVTKFTISASGLQPLTKYTFNLDGVAKGDNILDGFTAESYTHSICTGGSAATNLKVDELGTNSGQIKITWTKPVANAPALKVSFDGKEEEITDVTTQEHVFDGLKPNQAGTCSVLVVPSGTDNANCPAVEAKIACTTSNGSTVNLLRNVVIGPWMFAVWKLL